LSIISGALGGDSQRAFDTLLKLAWSRLSTDTQLPSRKKLFSVM